MKFLKIAIVVACLLLLSSCGGPFVRLDKPEYVDPAAGYSMQLPVGWVRITTPEFSNALMISRDGYTLQSIKVESLKHDKAFETSKKTASPDIPISDLAELEIAEIKAKHANAASIKVLGNTLTSISGQKAYMLNMSYLNEKGLHFRQITYGLIDKQYYYRLSYQAPILHYFERDRPTFERTVASFALKK